MMELPPGIVDSCPNALQGVSSQMFLTVVNALMSMKCELGPEGRYPSDYGPNLKGGDTFDFIIVGAGSAGCVVANRLSEVSEWKILLLEAGTYPSAITEIPGLAVYAQDTNEDWQYKTEPSKMCCLNLKDNRCRCPRGKGLGGTSLLNTMYYTRSTKYDHDQWYSNGNIDWDYASVVEYYKKHEHAHIKDNFDYGTNGELKLTRYKSSDTIRDVLGKSYQELGYGYYTENNPIGFRDTLMTIYKGTRMSTSRAFLTPVKNRTNLYVSLNSHVHKLIIDSNRGLVRGVQVKIDNTIINLKAMKEVIVSAGSINTPGILMNSGIGPKEHLATLGIPVVNNLKVGENLQDHFTFSVFVSINESHTRESLSQHQMINELYNFFLNREGELTKSGIGNFLTSVNTNNETKYANVQYFHRIVHKNDQPAIQGFARAKSYPDSITSYLTNLIQNFSLVVFSPTLLQPKSRGYIQLKNSDPLTKPLMIPNYVSNVDDMQVMLDSIRFVETLIKTKPLAALNAKIVELDVADCKKFVPQSNDYWKCLIRNIGSTSFHPVGTCKMGPQSDVEAVVNPRLQVYGVKRLRVIDGSIIPLHTSSNPNAPIIMIGEKGAAFIKEDWLK